MEKIVLENGGLYGALLVDLSKALYISWSFTDKTKRI